VSTPNNRARSRVDEYMSKNGNIGKANSVSAGKSVYHFIAHFNLPYNPFGRSAIVRAARAKGTSAL